MNNKEDEKPNRKIRFLWIALLLMVIFFTFMAFLYLKADEITKHPCSICAEKVGYKVDCYAQGYNLYKRSFYSNGSIEDFKEGGYIGEELFYDNYYNLSRYTEDLNLNYTS